MRNFVLIVALLCLPWWAAAQGSANALPTVSFTFDFPGSAPEHYSMQIRSDNHGRYESRGKMSEDSGESDSFQFEFQLSDATRRRIFDLSSKAKYFASPVDYTKSKIANTGKKTLAYHDGERNQQAIYNYSAIPAVQELTQIFQSLATTLEYARRLQFAHQYQRLALEEELKQMEAAAKSNNLGELQVLKPILQKIVADPSVLNVSRMRAQRLLDRTSATGS